MSTAAQMPSNAEKDALWQAYFDRLPLRVPIEVSSNPRIVLLNPAWNSGGYTFKQTAEDPHAHIMVSLQHQLYLRSELNRYTDGPTGLPEVWDVTLYVYNVFEAAYFGAPVEYCDSQVPDTRPIFDDSNKQDIFACDIEHPLENPLSRYWLDFWHKMEHICSDLKFEGRPVRLLPFARSGTDGPVTVACNLRGTDFLMDLVADPEYADKLMEFLVRAAINTRQAFGEYWGDRVKPNNIMADDSCAMVSPEMYKQRILPLHKQYYDAGPATVERQIHLCGDATHLFPLIHQVLNVTSFDTGFPVDHGNVRQQLGDDVAIFGGPEVALLLSGSTDQVYKRTAEILQSGVKQGGRFILKEGNNLPPNCPLDNLEAMYAACHEYGWYSY